MKILKKDLKNKSIKLKPESLNDLWVLEKIIQPDDIISGRTLRSLKIDRGDSTIKKDRKWISVVLKAEKIDFAESGEQLRINGIILEGSDEVEHAHHTFEITPNSIVTIQRNWKKYELEKLETAKTKHPKILVCILDDSEANFFMLTERIEELATMRGITGKSLGQESRESYFKELEKYISEKSFDHLIIAGPGFAKETLIKTINVKNLVTDTVAHTGEVGLKELMNRNTIDKVTQSSEISKQTKLVEEFMTEISKDGKIVYGKEQTEQSIKIGALDKLLISEELVRDNESLLEAAEKNGATVFIIDTHHDAGERFKNFGIGGMLRYKV